MENFPKSINVQDGIRPCRLDFSKIYYYEKQDLQNFYKINKRAGWNKAVQAGIFQKINKLCSTFIRQTRVGTKEFIRSYIVLWFLTDATHQCQNGLIKTMLFQISVSLYLRTFFYIYKLIQSVYLIMNRICKQVQPLLYSSVVSLISLALCLLTLRQFS